MMMSIDQESNESAIEQIMRSFESEDSLLPVVVQDFESKEVLMLAYVNRAALTATMETARATYWSRSRNELWVKGATSGNTQQIIEIAYDCDADSILYSVKQEGSACHTGARSCFFKVIHSRSA